MNNNTERRWETVRVVVASIVLISTSQVVADIVLSVAERLGPEINSTANEWMPRLAADGLSLHFQRDYDNSVSAWVSTRATTNDPWSKATGYPEGAGGITELVALYGIMPGEMPSDGLEYYYWDTSPGGFGNSDIYVTRGAWAEAVNIGSPVNSSAYEIMPSVSPDGLELYFSDFTSHFRPGGHGGGDLWATRRLTRDAPWEEPMNLGAHINSASQDARLQLSSDGLLLFFDSRRAGGYGDSDLYMSRRKSLSDPWGKATNLGPQVNSSASEYNPGISPDGRTLYFVCNHDIWQAPILPLVDFDSDGEVNAEDISILLDHWHTSDPLCDIGPMPWGDGRVDAQDLKALSEHLEPGFGRIAHWKLDETEGDIAYDSVGSDQANVHGEAVWQPDAGVIRGALALDGADDYIAPMTILNPVNRPFRIIAWVKGGAPGQVIASQTSDEFMPGSAYLAADSADGTLVTDLMFSDMPLDSDMVITDGEWHEVGLEWDGEHRQLLVDGNQAAVDEIPLPAMSCTGYLNIGTGRDMEPSSFWSGMIDDVRVYEKGGGQ